MQIETECEAIKITSAVDLIEEHILVSLYIIRPQILVRFANITDRDHD